MCEKCGARRLINVKKPEGEKTVIRSVLEEELGRNIRMSAAFSQKAGEMPHGSLMTRKIGNYEYCYLKYRAGKKTIAKYLGKKGSVDIAGIRKGIAERKQIEQLLKRLKIEKAEIEKALR
jgi:hypothetical protein